jgi:hypothetical protein
LVGIDRSGTQFAFVLRTPLKTMPVFAFRHLTCILLALVSCLTCLGRTVTLAWEKNPEDDILGYRVHVGTVSGHYTTSLPVGNVPKHRFKIPDAPFVYLAVTAVNSDGLESKFSQEIIVQRSVQVAVSSQFNRVIVDVKGLPHRTYVVVTSPDLVNWSFLARAAADDRGHLWCLEPLISASSKRFYRAVELSNGGPLMW